VVDYGDGSALITRIHHCYADGIALIQVLLSMTHATARGSLAMKRVAAPRAPKAPADFWEQVLKPLTGAIANPLEAAGVLQGTARKGVDLATEIARLATMGRDAETRFKGTLGTRKRAAWATPLPLDEVKAVGKALGCSINDVLLSMAAGALRDYLEERGDPVEDLEIRAIVPVNLRPAAQAGSLGNQFGLVFLGLPIGIAHPLERLYEGAIAHEGR
jgi:hypothetical protein